MKIWEEFLEATKMMNCTDIPRNNGEPRPQEELSTEGGIKLSEYKPSKLWESIFNSRRTIRNFSDKSLTQDELAYLLWATQGMTGENDRGILRTSPSAGATHPLDTYLMIQNVEGITKGIYRYSTHKNVLVPVNLEDDACEKFTKACINQMSIQKCAVLFVWVVDIKRSYWRFGNRAFRYAFIDSGHVCDNLYFAAQGVDCGVCAIGAYDDDELNAFLGLDGEDKLVAYAASLGKI